MGKHRVNQGETISSLAAQHGFSDWEVAWGDPANSDLKSKRDPHILAPGDIVTIPDRTTKQEAASTEQRHRFRLKRRRVVLLMRVLDADGEPYASTDFRLEVGSMMEEGTTDGDGYLEVQIPPTADKALLEIAEQRLEVKIGWLDPVDMRSGQIARLVNMGYLPGDLTHPMHEAAAIQDFQFDAGLKVDGIIGPNTKRALEERHGC